MARRAPNRGSESWLEKHPEGPLARRAEGGMATDGRMPNTGYPVTNLFAGQNTSFLPFTPGFESGLRGLQDVYNANLMNYQTQMQQVGPQAELQLARNATDQQAAMQRLLGQMAGRGLYDSGIQRYLANQEIEIPYGRQSQDIANWQAQQYAALQGGIGQANLGYQQQLADLYLQLAAQQAANIPLELMAGFQQPSRVKPNKPNKPGKKGGKK